VYYSIFPINNTPQYLLDRHPNPAKYTVGNKSFYVFGDADINDESLGDISSNGFNHIFQEGNPGLTVAQLKSNVNSRISNQQSFKVSLAQGRYMWEQEWKPKED
jgi:hypothetical protein